MGSTKGFTILLFPGIILTAIIAITALLINNLHPPLSPVIIAIITGLLVNNLIGFPSKCKAGIDFSSKQLLKLGIILLGIRLSFYDILNLGAMGFAIILVCIGLALTLVINISKRIDVPPKLTLLIAIGTAICGNSAIVAASPIIKAKAEEMAFAIATITVFGLTAIIVYPVIGTLLGLSALEFGTWAGTAINDTGQVVAAGFQYGESAGEVATVVKLTRNTLIAPVIIFLSFIAIREDANQNSSVLSWQYLFKIFPWFVFGFIFMVLVRTTEILPNFLIDYLSFASGFLLVMALAGIGLSTKLSSLKSLGLKALFTGLMAAVIMGVTSLLMVVFLL